MSRPGTLSPGRPFSLVGHKQFSARDIFSRTWSRLETRLPAGLAPRAALVEADLAEVGAKRPSAPSIRLASPRMTGAHPNSIKPSSAAHMPAALLSRTKTRSAPIVPALRISHFDGGSRSVMRFAFAARRRRPLSGSSGSNGCGKGISARGQLRQSFNILDRERAALDRQQRAASRIERPEALFGERPPASNLEALRILFDRNCRAFRPAAAWPRAATARFRPVGHRRQDTTARP